ncbi:MAG TPA: transketolase C-terminal domain-containing protein, partial [Oligoflexia bacterium]|nr:transketolase C-terminal domain-containing protein [Oligoflexia bacterium]
YLHFGVREHAMGSIMNGLSYYGGYIPYGSTFFAFLDYMRPSVRLAALSHLPALYIFTHDSIFLGEDGPTHQPVEHLAIMRATPNLFTYRPADGLETAVCYAHALSRRHGPSALILTRQNLEQLERSSTFSPAEIRKGAYVVFETAGAKEPAVVIVATGSEVACSVQAAKILSAKCAVRVVSMPCTNLFLEQPESYRRALLPQKAKKVVVEAASPFGWAGILGAAGDELLVLGIENRFGASAPLKVLAEKFGFTAEAIAQRVSERFC